MGQLTNEDWEQSDIEAVISGVNNNGVVSGLAVSESSPAAMSVLVAAGNCVIDGVVYEEGSGQNLVISNGDATHPRKDIIVYDATAGNPAVVAGTPAAAPHPPDIPAGDIYLAMVAVAASESTSITNADITEGRVYVNTIMPIRTVSANDTALDADYVITVSASGGSRTITLPTAVGIRGKIYVVKKTDSSNNTVTIDPNGTQTIDGESTIVINHENESVMIISNNSNWNKISEYQPYSQWSSLSLGILPTTDSGWNTPAGDLVNATDGDLNTYTSEAIHNSGGSATEKITIDLGSLKNIIQISSIANIKSGTAHETSMSIYTSTDNISYTLITSTSSGTSGNYVKKHLVANPLEKIRYIQIQFYQYNAGAPTYNGYFKLHEVCAFGWD